MSRSTPSNTIVGISQLRPDLAGASTDVLAAGQLPEPRRSRSRWESPLASTVPSMSTVLRSPHVCSPPPTLSIPVSHLTYVSTAETDRALHGRRHHKEPRSGLHERRCPRSSARRNSSRLLTPQRRQQSARGSRLAQEPASIAGVGPPATLVDPAPFTHGVVPGAHLLLPLESRLDGVAPQGLRPLVFRTARCVDRMSSPIAPRRTVLRFFLVLP
jgi:hypothetical protein